MNLESPTPARKPSAAGGDEASERRDTILVQRRISREDMDNMISMYFFLGYFQGYLNNCESTIN
jgi:hypothetical protein